MQAKAGQKGPVGWRSNGSEIRAANLALGRLDRTAANAVRRVVRRGRCVVLVERPAAHLMLGAAAVLACPAQDWASQEKADQERGEECSHPIRLRISVELIQHKNIVFHGLVKRLAGASDLDITTARQQVFRQWASWIKPAGSGCPASSPGRHRGRVGGKFGGCFRGPFISLCWKCVKGRSVARVGLMDEWH